MREKLIYSAFSEEYGISYFTFCISINNISFRLQSEESSRITWQNVELYENCEYSSHLELFTFHEIFFISKLNNQQRTKGQFLIFFFISLPWLLHIYFAKIYGSNSSTETENVAQVPRESEAMIASLNIIYVFNVDFFLLISSIIHLIHILIKTFFHDTFLRLLSLGSKLNLKL